MRGDLHPVALTLSSTLPSRTHYAKPHAYVQSEFSRKRRPLHINGTEYESVTQAAKQLRIGVRTIYRLIEEGLIVEGRKNVISRPQRGRPLKVSPTSTRNAVNKENQ